MHGSSFAFMTIGSLFDFGIIFMSNKIKNFYDEPNDKTIDKNKDKTIDNNIEKNSIRLNSFSKTNGVDNENLVLDNDILNEKNLKNNISA